MVSKGEKGGAVLIDVVNETPPSTNKDKEQQQSLAQVQSATITASQLPITSMPLASGPLPQPLPQYSRHPHSFSINKNEEFEFEVPSEAPVFVPTIEEFKNPLSYISKIRPVAEKYGICKIKPPSTWQPPFTVDVDKLRFTPRVQRLNELEAKTRVKLNFLDQIAKFWELQGSSLKIPMVERKALDLYSLHRIVQEEGGIEQTTKDRKWSKVACRLGYPVGKSVGTILKGHYERILYPFDLFTSGKTEDVVKQKLEESELDDHDYKPHGIVSRQKLMPPMETVARCSQRTNQSNLTTADATESAHSQGCDDIERSKDEQTADEDAKNVELKRLQFYGAGPKMAGFKGKNENGKSRMNGKKIMGQRRTADPLAKYICHICNRGDIEEAMLLCDGCDDSYHTFCLMPPLVDIPKGEWRCPKCVVEEVSKPTEAFGFEQAQREYTLQQFGEMADQFKADYFNIPVHLVPTELVEREFWRIVSSIDEDVTVEYGADLHTMDHGSGFPTKSSLYLLTGDQEYAESSWNLNNLPLMEESILGHINADISGMKVPWMYVGMCFATFCWHNEDHWSYSINYLHWGEPKTWYGVPGNKAEAFENTMKRAAPELFQSQPDLLHQLVTIMNPNILMNAGVPVYRTDQHAGEFIITFPRAYHAGFNQGYNFAEAVNFAPADWMKMGRECINHYSTLRRFCVFSHDELVCKMALEPDRLNFGIATACYLDMAEMVDCEKKLRKSLLEWGVTKAEREAFELLPDDERQCEVCKTTCFLSAVTCSCVNVLVCLRHYSELCKCPPEKHTLKYRYTLDELPLMLRKLKVKAESFENWLTQVRDVIDPNKPTTISLEYLQELAQEAEDKKFPGSMVIERLNSAVLEAEKCVTVIQQLDINKMRTRTRNSCEFAKYKLTVEELDLFVQEIDNLCCVIQEGNSVRELQQMGKEFVEMATYLLKQKLNVIDERAIEKLIDEGSSLCIELPQIKALKYVQEQVHWYGCVREVRESGEKIPIATVKRLLNEGLNIVPHSILEKELAELQDIMIAGEEWEIQAKQCFESGTQHEIPEIEELLQRAELIEVNLPMQPMLKDALKKAKEWLATVEILQTNENYPYFHTLENVVNRGKNIPFQLEELKRMEDHLMSARLWKQRTIRTFLKKSTQFALMEALSPRSDPVMLPNRFRLKITDEQFNQQFTEEMGPVQIVVAFKSAEEKEMREMRELRRVNSMKNPEDDKFCICRRRFYGNMYNCQLCKDWLHSSCVPTPRNTVRPRPSNSTSPTSQILVPPLTVRERDRESKYLCPSCMRSRRPRLETILSLLVSLQRLPIRLPEGEALQCLTERAMNWQDRARQALATEDVVIALASLSVISQKMSDITSKDKIDKSAVTQIEKTTKRRSARSSESSESSTDNEELAMIANINMNFNDEIPSGVSTPSPTSFNISHRNIEHAYSVPLPSVTYSGSPNYGKTAPSLPKSDLPLITLSQSTKDYLEDLMMEGDLLEVSLDETQHLWRILNAAKPSISDLAYINFRYKILPYPNEILVSNNRKRCSDEHISLKKNTKQNRQSDQSQNTVNQGGGGGVGGNGDGGGGGDGVGGGGVGIGNITTGGITSSTPLGTGQKLKRGRKMKILTKDCIAGDGVKKKKRGRKSVQENQALAAASTSDEDEDCSATHCVRPAGREVDWVQCDGGCNKWFHMFCVGLVKSQVKPDDDFVCKKCKKQSKTTVSVGTATTTVTTSTILSTLTAPLTTTASTTNHTTIITNTTTTTCPKITDTGDGTQRPVNYEDDYPDDYVNSDKNLSLMIDNSDITSNRKVLQL